MFTRLMTAVTIVSFCLLVGMLISTNPTDAGPFGILVVFIFSYVSLIGIVTLFLYYANRSVVSLSRSFLVRKPLMKMSAKRAYYYSTVIALAPIMLIGLQSVGDITFYEIALVVLFVAVGVLYVSKRV